jgi:hypothetical protein
MSKHDLLANGINRDGGFRRIALALRREGMHGEQVRLFGNGVGFHRLVLRHPLRCCLHGAFNSSAIFEKLVALGGSVVSVRSQAKTRGQSCFS